MRTNRIPCRVTWLHESGESEVALNMTLKSIMHFLESVMEDPSVTAVRIGKVENDG